MVAKGPFFIAIEGIDKCGKKTQAEVICEWLNDIEILTLKLKEPHRGTPIGRLIQDILQGKAESPGNLELQRLFTLDRAQGVLCFVRPNLTRGATILMDRYAYSTIAYSAASGIPAEDIIDMQYGIIGPAFMWPDLTVFIDISPEESIRRLRASEGQAEYFEKLETLRTVRDAYLKLLNRGDIGKIVQINGECGVDEVSELIKSAIRGEFDL